MSLMMFNTQFLAELNADSQDSDDVSETCRYSKVVQQNRTG